MAGHFPVNSTTINRQLHFPRLVFDKVAALLYLIRFPRVGNLRRQGYAGQEKVSKGWKFMTPKALFLFGGPVAQLVEHLTFNQRVLGSSPSRLTISRLEWWNTGILECWVPELSTSHIQLPTI